MHLIARPLGRGEQRWGDVIIQEAEWCTGIPIHVKMFWAARTAVYVAWFAPCLGNSRKHQSLTVAEKLSESWAQVFSMGNARSDCFWCARACETMRVWRNLEPKIEKDSPRGVCVLAGSFVFPFLPLLLCDSGFSSSWPAGCWRQKPSTPKAFVAIPLSVVCA